MTYSEILDKFTDSFPFANVEDYRPVCHELFEDGKEGCTIWLDNGDMVVYYPNQEREVIQMVTSDGYILCQKKNQIIIDLPQTWETLDCSVSPIVDRQPYLSTEQEMCLLAIVKEFMRGDSNES